MSHVNQTNKIQIAQSELRQYSYLNQDVENTISNHRIALINMNHLKEKVIAIADNLNLIKKVQTATFLPNKDTQVCPQRSQLN
jgi:hypothetical protein